MATAIRSPRSDEIKFETNAPQRFALKYTAGKEVGEWGNVMFTTVDGRRLFLNAEDAGEMDHALLDLRYKAGELIQVTRVKHGNTRGGGFAIRVERVDGAEPAQPASGRIEPAQPTRTEALLEKSVEMVRNHQRPAPEQVVMTPASVKLCATLKTLLDALNEAKSYAARLGLEVSAEDLRCLTVTAFIQDARDGGR